MLVSSRFAQPQGVGGGGWGAEGGGGGTNTKLFLRTRIRQKWKLTKYETQRSNTTVPGREEAHHVT